MIKVSSNIVEAFENIVIKKPQEVALFYENQSISYGKLNTIINKFAHYLIQQGIKKDQLVTLIAERSLDAIISIFSILKIGATYIPLDITLPSLRLKTIIDELKPWVIKTQANKDNFDFVQAHQVFIINNILNNDFLKSYNDKNLNVPIEANLPAYIIYTSGSTGKPKGVVCSHKTVINRINSVWRFFPPKQKEKCAFQANLGFVDAVWEIFGPLLCGVPLIIQPNFAENDPGIFIESCIKHSITRIGTTPSFLNEVLNYITDEQVYNLKLKHWEISGERYLPETIKKFFNIFPNITLFNRYGLTEATGVIYQELNYKEEIVCTIREYYLDNTQIYVVNENMELVKKGEAGELCISGDCLALEYFKDPTLTATKFLPNPYYSSNSEDSKDSWLRFYKTGDLVRLLSNSYIEFLGRLDEQVKVRGFRVELQEIEKALYLHNNVAFCTLVVVRDKKRELDTEIIGYIVPKITSSLTISNSFYAETGDIVSIFDQQQTEYFSEHILKYLKRILPEYMIPTNLVFLDKIPQTLSGKIDKKILPLPTRNKKQNYIAPRSEIEANMAKIWSEVLDIERISIHENFFNIGGHSLNAIRIISYIKKKYNCILTVRMIFEHPTIAELSCILQQSLKK